MAEKTFYIETFGCQMNMHDSEKVRGTLVSKGYEEVEEVERAGFVLYNTCSIRDKAEQKVFSRLANFKKLKAQGKIFGVLGCVVHRTYRRMVPTCSRLLVTFISSFPFPFSGPVITHPKKRQCSICHGWSHPSAKRYLLRLAFMS